MVQVCKRLESAKLSIKLAHSMGVLGGLRVAVAVGQDDTGNSSRSLALSLGALVDDFALEQADVIVSESAKSSLLKVRIGGQSTTMQLKGMHALSCSSNFVVGARRTWPGLAS